MSQRRPQDPAGRRLGMILRRLPFSAVAYAALALTALVGAIIWPWLRHKKGPDLRGTNPALGMRFDSFE